MGETHAFLEEKDQFWKSWDENRLHSIVDRVIMMDSIKM